jgi:hypothetical protein
MPPSGTRYGTFEFTDISKPIFIANFSTVRPSGFADNIRWDNLQLQSERSRS